MTRMVEVIELVDRVRRYSPSAAEPRIEQAIIEAARDLCTKCKVWNAPVEETYFAQGDQPIESLVDAEPVAIVSACFNDTPLEPISFRSLSREYPNWAFSKDQGQPSFITQSQPNTFVLYPQMQGTVKMMLQLRPTIDALHLPKSITDAHSDLIVRGAAGIVLIDPKSENPQLGLAHTNWFDGQLRTLSTTSGRGQQRAPARTKARWF